jgi:polyisoprenoid-binding protein YceI
MVKTCPELLATVIVAGLALLGGAGRAAAQERVYEIDSACSRLAVEVGKAGLFSGLGHAHTITAPKIEGRIKLDAANVTAGRVWLAVPAADLQVADAGIDDEDRAEIKSNMDAKVLKVGSHPRITFESTGVAPFPGEPGRYLLSGRLKLCGISRPVSLKIALEVEGGELRATGSTVIKQTDFGIEPFSAALGTIKVSDEVTVAFDIRARAPEAGASAPAQASGGAGGAAVPAPATAGPPSGNAPAPAPAPGSKP